MNAALNCPRGVATDNRNQLIICDSYCHRLIITDLKFKELKILGRFGTGSAEFYSPFDVLYHDTFVYVCDTGNKRIQKFTDNFGHLHSYQLNFHPVQIIIIDQLVVIRDDNNFLNFHDFNTFKLIKTSNTKGVIGIIGKRLYQIDKKYIYFYDSKGNLNSKTKIDTDFEFNNGNACIFRKDIVVTAKDKLFFIENVL